jgi:aerobic carbon-monoxide dehydrogenase medium subunit
MSAEYHEPRSWAEAIAILAAHGDDAVVLAGGTAYMLLLRQSLIRPAHVVGLRRLPGATRIDVDAHGGLSIGAMATHTHSLRAETVRGAWPELADALAKVATIRIRDQATVTGSVAHADPASDAPAMLCALGAQAVVVSGPDAAPRRVPVDALLVDLFTTSLAPAELIHSIEIPARTPWTRAVYLKYTSRSVDDYATVSVAARADIVDGAFRDLRIFLAGVGPKPMRASSVENALRGAKADGAFAEAAALVRADIDPIDDVRGSASYKREMSRVWTERALRKLAA